MHNDARLLTAPRNYAVVQLPGRRFPGVVFQGDSLNNLIRLLESARHDPDPEERDGLFEEALEILLGARRGYETALREAGLDLPYPSRLES